LFKPLGQFDHHPAVDGTLDFSEGNDEPQAVAGKWIGLDILKHLPQSFFELAGIVGVHNESSRGK
jgi:hypothetical protein